jgi:excisionase family DNA binding protein
MIFFNVQLMQMKQIRKFCSIGEIADYCSVNPVTVRRWIDDGKLSAMRLPSGHHRVRVDDFRQFLELYHMPIDEAFFN